LIATEGVFYLGNICVRFCYTKWMKLTKRRVIAFLLVTLVVFLSYFTWQVSLRFLLAESALNAEYSALNLPSEFQLKNSTFSPGSCLDNCPSLQKIFTVNGTREHFGQILKQRFEARGYTVDYSAGDMFTNAKNKVRALSSSRPELETRRRGYENNLQQQDQLITEVRLNLEYVPE